MNREQKAATIEKLVADIEGSEAIFAVDYRGISVPQAAELRTKLREADAKFTVVKNSLTERAADQAGTEALKPFLAGPTALTFVRGDAALAAKALADYARVTQLLPFKGGLLGEETLDAEQIRSISRLPSREVLYGTTRRRRRLAGHRPGTHARRAHRRSGRGARPGPGEEGVRRDPGRRSAGRRRRGSGRGGAGRRGRGGARRGGTRRRGGAGRRGRARRRGGAGRGGPAAEETPTAEAAPAAEADTTAEPENAPAQDDNQADASA